MQFLSNLKMGVKLIGSYLILAAIAAGVGIVGIREIRAIDAESSKVYEKVTLPLGEMGDLREKFQRQRVDIRDAIMTGDTEKGRQKLDAIDAELEKVEASFQTTLLTPEGKALWKTYKENGAAYDELTRRMLALVGSGKTKEADALLRGDGYKQYKALQEALDGLETIKLNVAKESDQAITVLANNASNIMVTFIVVGALIGIAIGVILTRAITGPLGKFGKVLEAVAGGDLTVSSDIQSKDELGQMSQVLNSTVERLRESMLQVQESAMAIATASGEISMGNTDLSSRTEEQAANLEEVASSMEEITSNVNQTADNARSANQESAKARQVAQDGGDAVTQVIAAMDAINQSSAKINEIIGVVDEIAFQTNLLALNAAVEAARAGEQGRGFAVVATEVRNLAKRSADAAKEIKILIRESVAKSVDGNKVAAHAGETIQEVVANVQRVTSLVGEIAGATQEQSTGLNEINKAVVQMDEVTQQNAALVEESAAAAESLDAQAHALSEVVASFKTGVEVRRTSSQPTAPRRPQAPMHTGLRPTPAKQVHPTLKRPSARPELATGKKPVPTPKNDEDGQWEAF